MKSDFLEIKHGTETEFEEIAEKLLNDYAIQNHESKYRITEIEFYWTTPDKEDRSTYKRNHVDPRNGDWFFHYSGVDIALKNNETNGYGGILIRGIKSLSDDKKYNGPMVCSMKLFSGTNAFNESIQTKIIEHRFEKQKINKRPRKDLGKNAIESGTDKLNYNFYITI